MEKQKMSFDRKMVIFLCVIGICIFGYFAVYLPFINRGEGDPYFIFSEVPFNMTVNNTVIHLEDQDIMHIRGLEVKQEKGKITYIFIRYSETKTPEIGEYEFNQKFGSSPYDPSSRKYLEYRGVYYFAVLRIS